MAAWLISAQTEKADRAAVPRRQLHEAIGAVFKELAGGFDNGAKAREGKGLTYVDATDA